MTSIEEYRIEEADRLYEDVCSLEQECVLQSEVVEEARQLVAIPFHELRPKHLRQLAAKLHALDQKTDA